MHRALPIIVLALTSCAAAARLEAPPRVRAFLDDFAAAVEAHRWDVVMGYFDQTYLEQQHRGMLRGRTGQFLVEALGLPGSCPGYTDSEARAFACLSAICSVRAASFADGRSAEVTMALTPRCGGRWLHPTLRLVPSAGTPHAYALVGPLG